MYPTSKLAQNEKISRNRRLDLEAIAGELTPLTVGKAVEV